MMEPSVLSEHLKQLADLIDRSEAPNSKVVRAEIASMISSLDGGVDGEARQAAKLEKFLDKDFEAAVEGLDNLIKKLSKTSQTLNPQDEGKAEIEATLTDLHQLRSGVKKTIESIESVNI